MATKFEAIYEAGLPQPLDRLQLTEHEQVTLKIADASDDQEFMQLCASASPTSTMYRP